MKAFSLLGHKNWFSILLGLRFLATLLSNNQPNLATASRKSYSQEMIHVLPSTRKFSITFAIMDEK